MLPLFFQDTEIGHAYWCEWLINTFILKINHTNYEFFFSTAKTKITNYDVFSLLIAMGYLLRLFIISAINIAIINSHGHGHEKKSASRQENSKLMHGPKMSQNIEYNTFNI